jgi:outer membrane protein assembly factor BamB
MDSNLKRKSFWLVLVCVLSLVVVGAAEGATITVKADGTGDYPTIQEAIDASVNGDEIVCEDGTYTGLFNYNIDFSGKAITVRSENGPESCIIDCNSSGTGFRFGNHEEANSVVEGFTIRNGYSPFAGGIYCYNCSPTITNCNITNCVSADRGGGIYCNNGAPLISHCIISGNRAVIDGGGIYSTESDAKIENCVISGNIALDSGGGLYSDNGEHRITNCTIISNFAADAYGGIYSFSSLEIMHTILWGNYDCCEFEQIYLPGGTAEVAFSCIQDENPDDANIPFGEENSNIDDDPCFVSAGYWVDVNDANIVVEPNDPNALWVDGDCHLTAVSPCIDTGAFEVLFGGLVDMDGQPRVMGKRIDIGADEYDRMIVVTRPEGGEVWVNGSSHEIRWDSWGLSGTVDISYSTNGGSDWDAIDTGVSDTGSYMWTLPEGVDSNQCVVSVESADANVICIESGIFTIHPDFYHPAVGSTWKSLGNDFDRSGLSEDSGPELGCLQWQFQTDGPVTAGVTIGADNRVHIACEDGRLYTLDAEGAVLWSYDANTPLLSSPTVGHDGSVYVGGLDKKLYAIAINGSLRWTHATDGFIYSSPAISDDGEVYACSEDGTVYALGPDGSELWEFETAGAGSASGAIFASPAIGTDGDIYIGSVYEPNLYALDGNDGSVKWVCHFEDACDPNFKGNWVFSSPVVAGDGTIYQTLLYSPKRIIESSDEYLVGCFWYDAKFYAIDPNNGDIIWDSNMSDTARDIEWPPEPNEEPESYWFEQYYFIDTYERSLPPYPKTETRVMGRDWARYYRVSNSSFSSCALGPDGTIYVSFDDPYLRAVDPNGTMKWVSRLGMVGGPTLAVGSEGLVYAASYDGYLSVVNSSGEEVARFKGEEGLSYPVIASDGGLIVSDANNTIWAIGDGDCEGEVSVLHRIEDLDGNRQVNFIDFAKLAADWMASTFCNSDLFFYYAAEGETCDAEEVYVAGDVDRNLYNEMIDISMLADKWLSEN